MRQYYSAFIVPLYPILTLMVDGVIMCWEGWWRREWVEESESRTQVCESRTQVCEGERRLGHRWYKGVIWLGHGCTPLGQPVVLPTQGGHVVQDDPTAHRTGEPAYRGPNQWFTNQTLTYVEVFFFTATVHDGVGLKAFISLWTLSLSKMCALVFTL